MLRDFVVWKARRCRYDVKFGIFVHETRGANTCSGASCMKPATTDGTSAAGTWDTRTTAHWFKFPVKDKNTGFRCTKRLFQAQCNAATMRLIAAKQHENSAVDKDSVHNVAVHLTHVWPWRGKLERDKVRSVGRRIWHCCECGTSSGTAGYINGVHLTETCCKRKISDTRKGVKRAYNCWAKKLTWLQKARRCKRYGTMISDDDIALAEKMKALVKTQLDAEPISRSTLYRETKSRKRRRQT